LPDNASTIPLTTVLPEIIALIPAGERQLAEQVLHVPRLQVDGELADTLTATPTAFDFIVADGVVLKQIRYAGRNSLELLGPGDVLAPPLTPSRRSNREPPAPIKPTAQHRSGHRRPLPHRRTALAAALRRRT
jgi:hypothetical protein